MPEAFFFIAFKKFAAAEEHARFSSMKTDHPKIGKAMELADQARQRSATLLDCLAAEYDWPAETTAESMQLASEKWADRNAILS
eukprot:SAG22_NODE_8959_length_618_cov_1.352601_1_plen_83_part_01